MVEKNLPLARYERYREEYRRFQKEKTQRDPWLMTARERTLAMEIRSCADEKRVRRIARIIVNALTQRSVGDLVAKEWETLPVQLRMDVKDMCNNEPPSHNVVKGIQYLDRLLAGQVLRTTQTGPTVRTLKTVNGVYASVNRRINPAVAGASRAFAAYQRPPNYNTLSKRERKKIDRELAEARRRDRQG